MESSRAQRMAIWWSTTQFIVTTCFMSSFIYHLVQWRQIGEIPQCQAKLDINHPLSASENFEESTDVGKQFYIVFLSAVLVSIYQLICAVTACCLP